MYKKYFFNNNFLISKFDQHPMHIYSNDIKELCWPVKKYLNITFFSYTKIFSDNSHSKLTTHPNWYEYYYLHNYYSLLAEPLKNSRKSGYVLWPGLKPNKLITDAAKYFNIDNGIILIDRNNEDCEMYTFATCCNNFSILNNYIENIDLLYRFIFYFKEKAIHLINDSNKLENRIYIKSTSNFVNINYTVDKENFIKETPIKRYNIGMQNKLEVSLTKREVECLYFLLHGFTNVRIANKLCISKRTVEKHFDNIKIKLNVNKQSDIFIKIANSNFDKYLHALKFSAYKKTTVCVSKMLTTAKT